MAPQDNKKTEVAYTWRNNWRKKEEIDLLI